MDRDGIGRYSLPPVELDGCDRAAAAVAANPKKSDRAIAAELGVSPTTVGKAGELSTAGQLDTRVGLDRKVRNLPARKVTEIMLTRRRRTKFAVQPPPSVTSPMRYRLKQCVSAYSDGKVFHWHQNRNMEKSKLARSEFIATGRRPSRPLLTKSLRLSARFPD